jgi:RNA polymerase sigma-70 factor (ECF subfamily)
MEQELSWSTMGLVGSAGEDGSDGAARFEDDLRLMARAARRERASQQVVVDRLFPRVRRVCYRLLGDTADADDAVQTSLLELLQSAGTYRGLCHLEGWADRITARVAIRACRERSRWASRAREGLEASGVAAAPAERSATEATPRHPADYLRDLPEPLRDVLVLRHLLDYSVEEIAEQVGASPNTVKDRLLRARRAVRKQIRRDRAIGVRRPVGVP